MNNFNYNKLTPFKWFVLENFPFIEADFDALTEWQLFCKLGKEMNKIINSENTLGTQMENVTNAFIELQNYVNNYFDNLDVQEEINNKLNDMVEDGTLQEIISTYLNTKALLMFNNVNDMKNSPNLINGSYAKTLGFYENGDGGESIYLIKEHTNEIINNIDIIQLNNSNLIAILQIENQTINIKQLGAKGNGIDNDTLILQYALSSNSNYIKKIYLNEKYLINETLVLNSNKDIIGIKDNLQYNENYQVMFITNNDIIVLDLSTKTNINLENFNIKIPLENENTIVNFTGCRYINFKNIQCYHEENIKSSNIAFNDTLTEDRDIWSGYIKFENVRASYFKNSVKSKATLIDFKNCVFNNADDVNIDFMGEVCGIENCDISYSTTGKAVRTSSIYDLNIINSYLEGFYVDRCFEKTHNININLKGSKIYTPTGILEGRRLENTEQYPQPLRNTLNNLQDGYSSFINLLPNGNFNKNTFGYSVNAIDEINVKNKNELQNIGLPQYMDNALFINNGNIIHNFSEKLNIGDYITISYWIYVPEETIQHPYIMVVDNNNSNPIIQDRPTQRNKWVRHTSFAKVSEELANANNWRVRIACAEKMYITGISVMKGIATNIDATLTPNEEKILTDKLVIKGSDNKYYQLNFNGTELTFEEVNTI